MRMARSLLLALLCAGLVACGQMGPLTQREVAPPVVKATGVLGLTAYP